MPENNNVEFTFDYDEAETVERLNALTTVKSMLYQRGMQKELAGDEGFDDMSASFVVWDVYKSLEEYGEAKGYDIKSCTQYSTIASERLYNSPLAKAYDEHSANKSAKIKEFCKQVEEREKHLKEEFGFMFDESQFEMPEQNQRTL